ncbi:lipoprotein, putative [Roseobacter sp. AzwK-3b]|uniref:hypothetical protein n=1 Tax=Roseobacter sp. AzwK-3b TaxID=351016 RepID=UPI00015696B1|nr:hypothetical protein [Roseobacter sp. AzwK-3b]EDM73011.1 lipoprotein, putative [Roseobacter sp. AzwK-3b]
MVSGSKILTVSYGTFSCTLEGFDDSFETMKAIAEYFRDLAADDRYFGAEPPTPDAEMLARIAEREISRRVDAYQSDGSIVLRASDAAALTGFSGVRVAPKPAAPEPAPEPAPEMTAPAAPDPQVQPEQSPAPEAEVAEKAADHAPEPVAATEPEAAVAEAPVEDAQVEEAPVDETPAKPEEAEAPEAPADAVPPVDTEEPTRGETAETAAASALEESAEDVALAEGDAIAEEPELSDRAPDALEAPETEEQKPEAPEPQALHEADIAAPAPQQASDEGDEGDSIAAKLRRIRSVVLQSERTDTGDEYTEDQHAEVTSDPQAFLDSATADLNAALAEDDLTETAAGSEALDVPQDDLDSILARFRMEEAAADEAEAEEPVEDSAEAEEPEAEEVEAEELAEDHAEHSEIIDETLEDDEQPEAGSTAPLVLSQDKLAQLREDAVPASDTPLEPRAAAQPVAVETPLDGDTTKAARVRARVVKIKRSDYEAAIVEGYIEEDASDSDEPDTDEANANVFNEDINDSTLSPEQEAELQRELAEVEAEMRQGERSDDIDDADDDLSWFSDDTVYEITEPATERATDSEADTDADTDADAGHAAAAPEIKGRDKLAAGGPQNDVSRMFQEADNQRDEPESNRRRSVIQHLRAAVAATRADKKAGVESDLGKDQSPYRSDLADVVRPRRPNLDGEPARTRSSRPEETRPAPLKLVAEQRVDVETPREAIMPRRVSSSDLQAGQIGDTGFADFVEQSGASSLPELLEAAAAYLSDVEGRPQFSRPMLMGKLREVTGSDFSREDGLRSFGKLLRDGKLQKLKGGRFAVTDDTEFRTQEARNAG